MKRAKTIFSEKGCLRLADGPTMIVFKPLPVALSQSNSRYFTSSYGRVMYITGGGAIGRRVNLQKPKFGLVGVSLVLKKSEARKQFIQVRTRVSSKNSRIAAFVIFFFLMKANNSISLSI
jgi:hypothetical protein